jgi:hypothetical protein
MGAAFATAWIVGQARMMASDQQPKPLDDSLQSQALTGFGNIFVLFLLLGAFLSCYIGLIPAWEHFDYYDNSQFTLYTLKGHNYPPPIWPGAGRFFPLGFQEFNLLHYFTSSLVGFHAFAILQLLAVTFFLFTLDCELKITARACLVICILTAPSIIIAFGGLIYPERNVVFWLLCLIFFVKSFDRTQSAVAAVAAITSAQFLLYYKEVAFLLVWGFIAGRLLFRCRKADRPGWDFNRLREKTSYLDFCLGTVGLFFLLYYGAVMFGHTRFQYLQQKKIPELEVLVSYFRMDLLAWLFMAVVIGRACLIWKRRIVPSPFWEGLACAGLAYFTVFLYLGMFSAYYLAPVDVIAVLYVGRIFFLFWAQMQYRNKAAALAILCVILAQNLSLSTLREFERKNLVYSKDQIARVILSRCQSHSGAAQRLFFPFTRPYVTMEFAAYLSYCGISIEGIKDGPTNGARVVIISPAMIKEGPLMDYQDIIAHPGQVPEPGDLIIMLPDDNISLAGAAPYLRGGDTIFSREPYPQLSPWLYKFARHLNIVSPEFEHKEIPDHWLDASVTVWKQ